MALNNDRNLLEQQILSNSGLKGKELENLKARLATLSEQQLQAELSKSLSGNNKGEWYTGVLLEHNESVIMRNNHEQTTYTDDSGNEISELKDGDEVLERTIKSTDDKGNVFETTVTYSGGRPLTQTKSKNGNTTETTTYKYNDDADVPFVTVETKKADQSKVMTNVLEIDENGNFDNEDFIDRQTTSMDGTTTHIFTENNCVIEQQVKQNGKKIDTIYKGDSIEDYDNKKLHRVYQRTELKGEVHEVAYDGNGNTRTVVQNGESPSAIAKKFGVKESSLRRLNPARGKNAITQVGADIVVPGEYNADARVMTRRKSKRGAMQDFANDEVQRTAERLYSSSMQEVTLDKDYKDAYSYARALLAADGVKNPSNEQINNKANEILVANGNIKFKKGTKVQITAKAPDSKFVQDLSNNGFKPTRENAIFYNRFNVLNPSQQQNVLSVIKYCRSQKITDPNKIKARILETFPEINLFDSGKVIPMNSSFGTPAFQRKNPVALETFLTETLKLDLKSDVGRTVYERLSSLPQEELGKINGSNFGDLSKSDFNDIANRFESSGVNISTQFENQIEQNSRAHRAEKLGIPQQKFTSEMLANIYDRAADMMEEYYHNHGVFDAGTYLEGLKNITDWITPDNLFGIDMRSTLHVASDCRKAAQRFRQMHTDNPETFKREYAQLKKDGLVTADYNQQNVQEFMNLIQSGDVDINSDKFKNACKKAFGFKGVENTEKYIQTGQMAGNIGDIAVMLYTLGAASELKMMGKATQGVYGALERGAGRFMSKTAAQKTAKIGTSMAMGGTTLGGFTLGKETLNNLSNPMRDATSWETWKETGIASAESFGFGAFGGLLNETVVAPIVKAIEKPATKATQAVSKALTEQGELTGKQIMQTVSESGSLKLDGLFKMNSQELANLARTATAKGVGFGVEVTGFTAYEAGLDVIKDLIDPQTGRLPDDITVESLTKYLGEKFGEQFSNLGTIKGVSQLLMMSKGGKVAQKAMMNEILSKSDALKDIKFKKAEINGHEVYEIIYPNGNRAVVSSPEQAIATCQMAMQMEFLAKSLTEGEPKSEITRPQGMNAQENIDISKKHIESNEIDLDELLNGNPINLLNNENNFDKIMQIAKEQGKEKEYIAMYRQALKDSEKIDEILENILSKDQNLNALYNTNKDFASRINEIVNYGYYCKFNGKTGEKITNNAEYIKSLLNDSVGKIKDDVAKDKHYEEIINNCIDNPKSEEANKLYKQYLDEEYGTDTKGTFANVRKVCEKIHSDFGVKVFLPTDTKEAGVALKLVYQELSNFKMHAQANGETAKLPEVINFSTTSLPSFIKGTASGYSQTSFSGTDFVFVKGLTIDQIKYVLRHELTHVNDKLSSNEFPSDIDVKKYAEELLNAGVDVEHISYAYVNRHEFLAVASEGDIRSYSNEFKSVLEKLGMPKFILNMQNMRLANKKVTANEKNRLNQIMENIENEVKQYDKSNNGNFQVSTMSDAEFASKGNTSKIISEQSILDSTQRDILAKEICQIIDKNTHDLFEENDILEYLENFGFDKEKCNTFKTLLEVKVKALKENSSDREYEFLSLDNAYDLIDIYDTGDKLKACIALLENGVRLNIEGFKILENTCSQNRFYRPERKVAPWSNTIDCTLNEFIEKTAEYLNTVKGNESLEHNIMPDIILQKNSTEIISDALKENPNITFEELIQKFNENNILKLNKVKDSEMKRLALELLGANRFITEDTMQIIMDICNKPQDLLENNRTVDIINNLKKSIKNGEHIKLKDELKNISSYTDKIALDTNISMSDIKTQLTQIGVFDHIVDELSQKYGNNETVPTDIINFANEFFNLGKIKFGKEYNRDIKDGYIDPEKYVTAEKNRMLRWILDIATDKSGKPNINELNKIMDYLTEQVETLYVDDLSKFLSYGKNKNGEIDLESVKKVKNAITTNPKITYQIGSDFFSSVSSLRHHLKTEENSWENDSYDYESYNKLLDSVEKPWDVGQMNSILGTIGENVEARKAFINNPRPSIEFIAELQSKGLVRYRDDESDIEGLNLPITEIQTKALNFIRKAKITRDDRKELFDILNNLTETDFTLLNTFFDKYDDGKLSLIIEHIAEFREYDKKSQDAFIKALKNDVFSTYERYDKNKCINFKKSLVKANDATRKLLDVGVTKLCWENVPDFFNGNANGNYIKLSKKQSEFALRLFEICQEEGNSLSTHDEINNLIANAHPDTYECIENYLKAQKPGKKYYRTVLETVNKIYSENKNAIQEYQDFIKENPEYKDELGIKAGLTALDKFKILAKDKELLNSLFADKDYYISEILTDYDYVTSASIEKSMQNLPELTLEAKTKFPHALGRLFLANLSNQSSKNMADIYNIISKYDKDVALRLENILSKFGLPNNMITYTSNIDYLVDCIKNEPTRGRQLSEQFINNVAFLTRDIKEIENIINKAGFPRFKFEELMETINIENVDNAISMLKNYKEIENPDVIIELLSNENKITYKQVQHLIRAIGKDKFNKLNSNDLIIACKFISLHGKSNINEIPIADKRDLLHSLVSSNTSLFKISDDLSREFPLIPKNQEEYCSLLPSIVRSLGIETNELTPEQRITMFNSSMGELSKSLAEISDTDFAKMTVTQEYPKDKFILDALDKVKSLPRTERQKVYDYFGFELHHNKENSTGFSITGYPVNLNNGKKLAQIEDPRTKAVVESLRPDVVRFSENNKIKCNNPQVERFLNEVIEALPELRTTIGKKQHGAQAFDVMQHSLKVMQKVAQDPKFESLNESDQKIMLLASLMHDITKSEGRVDKTHANEGSFDTYFIAQKFNLTKEEEVKLHTLIKNHEWLEYVNTAKSEDQLTKRLQSVAYDLHQGNLFDMAEIFTHADLRAVRKDDSFHDTTEGQSRIGFDGVARSFGQSADIYADRIRGYVAELQKSQPLLPQTKIPRASRINEAITQVNPDGSTNIKGVYKDKDGLVVIKFNEVEDWEAIGFPKGSISHGVEIKKGEKGDAELSEDVNTGNIKFFVHGLDYSNQLAKFDAFSLVDSDALLSVSYAERPESKFRFFRPQGVLLDVNSKYIHGGGNTDAGSGCGKDIAEFKNNYIFGGHRESDRLYISDLIKTATGMTDEQYVDFVEQNKDRPIQEIEPVEIRDKIVKAFATINSNTRKGKREYNEMYISNPNEVMGVFAYSMDYNETIGNPVNFLNRSSISKYEKGYGTVGDISVRERTEFLRKYALERNLPFIIFGD